LTLATKALSSVEAALASAAAAGLTQQVITTIIRLRVNKQDFITRDWAISRL
jgi:hypothetical protein